MKNYNTSLDFIEYAYNNGYSKKNAKIFLTLLKEFCYFSLAKDSGVLLSGLVTFKIKNTTTTLHSGKTFRKVKAFPSIKLLKLIVKKC